MKRKKKKQYKGLFSWNTICYFCLNQAQCSKGCGYCAVISNIMGNVVTSMYWTFPIIQIQNSKMISFIRGITKFLACTVISAKLILDCQFVRSEMQIKYKLVLHIFHLIVVFFMSYIGRLKKVVMKLLSSTYKLYWFLYLREISFLITNKKIRFLSPRGGQQISSTFIYCINISTCFVCHLPSVLWEW